IKNYISAIPSFSLVENILIIPGGEQSKNNQNAFDNIIEAVHQYGIDRHSYIVAIGGGSLLDIAGYAAAVSHRGIRHIRIPSTVLSQNDSGVGVKNGINFFGKKNFLGTFAPPVVVFNDYNFLHTLDERHWRSGISEAIKVALIKDPVFFAWLEENASLLAQRDMASMKYLIKRCAELHLQHIAGGDPFEMGSSRPLDFGHWSGHKLEQLTHFSVLHGEAVAMGIVLDSVYSFLSGRITEKDITRILDLMTALGFDITHPQMKIEDENSPLIAGMNEFREHLGGKLTIMLLNAIGKGEEVHELDIELLKKSSDWINKNRTAWTALTGN
ncbi:MAG TPA: 3-dehydroquinate synthase, partial [Chitinophagaceae bacterium]|nr:3-dehydroquinate synthase [Chitinophagaceae bacterium]